MINSLHSLGIVQFTTRNGDQHQGEISQNDSIIDKLSGDEYDNVVDWLRSTSSFLDRRRLIGRFFLKRFPTNTCIVRLPPDPNQKAKNKTTAQVMNILGFDDY